MEAWLNIFCQLRCVMLLHLTMQVSSLLSSWHFPPFPNSAWAELLETLSCKALCFSPSLLAAAGNYSRGRQGPLFWIIRASWSPWRTLSFEDKGVDWSGNRALLADLHHCCHWYWGWGLLRGLIQLDVPLISAQLGEWLTSPFLLEEVFLNCGLQVCPTFMLSLITIFSDTIYLYFKIIPVNEFYPVFSNLSYVFNVSEIAAGKYFRNIESCRMNVCYKTIDH